MRADTERLIERLHRYKTKKLIRCAKSIGQQIENIQRRTVDPKNSEKILPNNLQKQILEKFAAKPRIKRGLVDGIGMAATYLFGLATEDELEESKKKIGAI